jgi:hypothetical protein
MISKRLSHSKKNPLAEINPVCYFYRAVTGSCSPDEQVPFDHAGRSIPFNMKRSVLSLLQNSSFVEDLFAPVGELKKVRTAISGMMRFSSQTS